ncbi:hypothetical protein [Rhizobium sp. FKY42]|uniref:hypothetical protein n=1 Tax=Rhizobium sp. FKY42 TaxID=2562310 RepID=UPI0010C1085D|nr:hypothetical protein [Rhizobium sp. FKY42]
MIVDKRARQGIARGDEGAVPLEGMIMDLAYQVADMTIPEIDRAFPLATAGRIATDLAQWREFCETIIKGHDQPDRNERLIVCANGRGYLKALCMTRVMQTEEGPVLDVPVQVIATVVDEDGVRRAMHDGLVALAYKTGSVLRETVAA